MKCQICETVMKPMEWRKKDLGIMRCPLCGFFSANLTEWQYPYAEHDYYAEINPKDINSNQSYIKHRVAQILQFAKKGRAVDLGCGLGETAISLRDAGFEAYGVEESRNAIDFLNKNYPDVKWCNSRIEPFLEKKPETFDVITLFHVLEHIPSLRSMSNLLAASLRPKGLLVIEVPDVSGGQSCLRGKHWHYWLPHHVNYFSLATLQRLFVPLGLEYVGREVKYHLRYPQGVLWRDSLHSALANLGLHDIITTYWRKTG